MLPTLILFVKDDVGGVLGVWGVRASENVCKRETRYLTGLKTTKELKRERDSYDVDAVFVPHHAANSLGFVSYYTFSCHSNKLGSYDLRL